MTTSKMNILVVEDERIVAEDIKMTKNKNPMGEEKYMAFQYMVLDIL